MTRWRLLPAEERVEVGGYVRAGPILRTNDFAVDAAVAVDDVGVGKHGGAILEWNIARRITESGKTQVVSHAEFLVSIFVLINRDAENGAATRLDLTLELIERGRLIDAGRAPSRPKIQHYDMTA